MSSLTEIADAVLRKYIEYKKLERPIPPWLQKQRDGLYLIHENVQRGMALLADGMQEEKDMLEKLL